MSSNNNNMLFNISNEEDDYNIFVIADTKGSNSNHHHHQSAHHYEDQEMNCQSLSSAPKKRRLAAEERLKRSRERNRIHARKTRERKKLQMSALEARVDELKSESQRMKQLVDERYTADLLVVLSTGDDNGPKVPIQSSTAICEHSNVNQFQINIDAAAAEVPQSPQKRVRRRGKYTPQEREKIRRERNRMHAKKTRDKKKSQFDMNEQFIVELEKETRLLREYLVSVGIMSQDEALQKEKHDKDSKIRLALFKNDDDVGDEEEDDCLSNDGSGSGNSNDDDSAGSGGTTSGESGSSNATTVTGSSGEQRTSSSSQTGTRDNCERSDSCNSGGDSPPPTTSDERTKVDNGFSNYGPSKQGHKKKREATESSSQRQLHDVQNGMYGPSKQAHDAKRSKYIPPIPDMSGLRPI